MTVHLYDQQYSQSVSVLVVGPATQSERRFPLSLSIADLKKKLESVVAIPSFQQILSLQTRQYGLEYNTPQSLPTARPLNNDKATLSDYGIAEGDWTIIVTSSDGNAHQELSQYTDLSRVEKSEMADDDYDKRRDTVRDFKRRNQLGRFGEQEPAVEEPALPSEFVVGARCKVSQTSELSRLGTIRYIGTTDFAPGTYIGVEFDEPMGRNDGEVQGRRYFSCKAKYGSFVKPETVEVGDFQVEDDFSDLE